MKKTLLDGYVGVKFTPDCRNAALPAECEALYRAFRRCGDTLLVHDMAPANGGNLSLAVPGGRVVTASGCNLGCIAPEELSLLRDCSLEEQRVSYEGPQKPSSEAMLHWLIGERFPAARAVIHAHDALATSTAVSGKLRESEREEPYGTVELARVAEATFAAGGDIIVLKNHGYVAMGADLAEATAVILRTHRALLGQ